ncbi:MAG: hypothetical protein U0S76_09810 [Pseudoxanthomonas sp.]|nr:hypothetical protein [Pseudoxanthomonas sp.]
MFDYTLIAALYALALSARFCLDPDNDPIWKVLVGLVLSASVFWRLARPEAAVWSTLVQCALVIVLTVIARGRSAGPGNRGR